MAGIIELSVEMEKNLIESFSLTTQIPPARVDTWIRNCDKTIRLLNKVLKDSPLSVSAKQSLVARIGRLKSFRVLVKESVPSGSGLRRVNPECRGNRVCWRDIESAFEGRIRTGVVVNIKHIDPKQFLMDAKSLVIIRLRNAMLKHMCIKVNTSLNGEYTLREEKDIKCFNTSNRQLLPQSDLDQWYENDVMRSILVQMEEFQEKDSGWALVKLINLTVNINHCYPLNGSKFIDLPKFIQVKKAVVNVRSDDDACFAWAVVSALHPASSNVDKPSSYPPYPSVLKLDGITFPVTLQQIPKFEIQNSLSVNVFVYESQTAREVVPLYLTNEKKEVHVNLLMITNDETSHFCWIKNFSRLVSSQLSNSKHKIHICDRCLHVFHSQDKLDFHLVDCGRINECAIELPTEATKWLEFKNFNQKESVPYVVYADFECMLKNLPVDETRGETLQPYQKHEAYSVGYYVKCAYDSSLSRYESYRGDDPATWFVKKLKVLVADASYRWKNIVPMKTLSSAEEREFNEASNCHICQREFTPDRVKVRDHCHLAGRYRGPAHAGCNLNYHDYKVIPVIFHNLSGYDAHFIIKELVTECEGHVSVLPVNKEKYISFTKKVGDVKLRFIDSFRFLGSSLDKLVSYLTFEQLEILKVEFRNLDEVKLALLSRKGIFPYDYVDCATKLEDVELPSKEQFFSKLTDSDVRDADYSHAVKVWQEFDIRTLGEYSDLYLKTDVILLADVFESFRKNCMSTYGVDPAYYYTVPGLAWDVMLKITKIKLELLTDINMVLFVERGVRGGLSQCSNRYGRANNRYMANYDPSKESKYLMYFDVNNLYGWAMSQCLPRGKFQWLADVSQFDAVRVPDDHSTGYLLEVDLEYPDDIHDRHKDLPFCPDHRKAPDTKDVKLLATLHNKKRYVIHYRNLKQCLKNGLRLTAIHRILQFEQSPWLQKYIDLNTDMRARATNDFEKNLYKLMNNAVFGKTMENVRNYSDIKLVRKWEGRYGAKALISKPNFHRCTIFSENFSAIELRKLKVRFNKPIYVGMSILDLSKICLYRFHTEYMYPLFENHCKLLYTDTDSLIYEIRCEDIYSVIKRDIQHFDTSDYPPDNVYGIPLMNKKVPGLMKDENHGAIMTEFVGLRSKMYAIKVDSKETKRAKGVKNYVVDRFITFEDYLVCLSSRENVSRQQRCIRSKLHKVYSMREKKIALSATDTKRYVRSDSTDTLPWGHWRIPGEEKEEENKNER